MKPHRNFFQVLAVATALAIPAYAQAPAPATSQPAPSPTSAHVFHLSNITTSQEQIELINALRNFLDNHTKVAMLPGQNALVVDASPEQVAVAQRIISELDHRKPSYRLTYTFIDLDGTRRLGDQHYTMIVVPAQQAVLKQGNRVPIVTGTDLKNTSSPQSQVTYVDVGIEINATLDDAASSMRLKTKVAQSSVLEDRTGAALQDPVIRQSVFEGSAVLLPGKPLVIGSLDISGTTRRIDIQVSAEPVAQ